MEKISEKEEVLNFLRVDEYPSGSGYGYGYGSGDGYGYGSGDGDGYGSGYGYGYGDGYGYGYGSGDGYGYGSGDGDGYGSGYGYGYGDGYGSGYGYGYGSGDGYGYGSGDGDGYGSGYGYGVSEFNGQKVYQVDGVATLIDSLHANYAKGRILNSDFTTTDCYIAKCDNYFAHGDTLEQAVKDARSKYEENLPTEERIRLFLQQYPDPDVKIPAKELYDWHHKLTGSCLMGRKQFCEEHDIDYKDGSYTVNEFIALTRNAFGGDVIRQLETTSP